VETREEVDQVEDVRQIAPDGLLLERGEAHLYLLARSGRSVLQCGCSLLQRADRFLHVNERQELLAEPRTMSGCEICPQKFDRVLVRQTGLLVGIALREPRTP